MQLSRNRARSRTELVHIHWVCVGRSDADGIVCTVCNQIAGCANTGIDERYGCDGRMCMMGARPMQVWHAPTRTTITMIADVDHPMADYRFRNEHVTQSMLNYARSPRSSMLYRDVAEPAQYGHSAPSSSHLARNHSIASARAAAESPTK